MPELPEVETVVRDLNKKVKGRTITGAWLDWPKLIKHPSDPASRKVHKTAAKNFPSFVQGERIVAILRIAKNIIIHLTHGKMLLIHQKMTGHLLVGKWEIRDKKAVPISPKAVVDDSYNGYIHLILYLDNGKMLALSDVRKFAKVIAGTTEEIEALPELVKLGPDALAVDFSPGIFAGIIHNERRPIKQVLMDPEVVAGIGNIYADDILWQSQVHPLRRANGLTAVELGRVYKAMREILTKAVKLRGTSTSDFRDTAGKEGGYTEYRLVYQREGLPCQRCKTPIKRIIVGGRSAHFCSRCQKK